MRGTIYKFTILAGVLYNGNKPYYVGQYVGNKFYSYWGSGRLWVRFIKGLKNRFPSCWKKLIKREVLFEGECSQRTLDKLEEIYIRREHAHHSEGLGGCNILRGTANEFGSGSPMKDPDVARRVTEQLRGRKRKPHSEETKRIMSISAKKSWINADERRKIVSVKSREYMVNGGAERLSRVRKGCAVSDETRYKIKQNHADFKGKNHPCYGIRYRWVTNGVKNIRLHNGKEIPDGFYLGKSQKK